MISFIFFVSVAFLIGLFIGAWLEDRWIDKVVHYQGWALLFGQKRVVGHIEKQVSGEPKWELDIMEGKK